LCRLADFFNGIGRKRPYFAPDWVCSAILGLYPPPIGGFAARHVGPRFPVSRVATENLRRAFPDLDAAGRRRVVEGVWDNLGRTAAELPHLPSLRRTTEGPGWECRDDRELQALQARGGPALLFSGHLANWEIGLPVAASLGLNVAWFYRPASNPVSDRVLQALRREAMGTNVPMFPKGAKGGRAALAHLRQGGPLGMLIDQKLNEGIAVPFFGRRAMTTVAPAQFALRLRCPVIPIRAVRLGPARFRVICEPPVECRLRACCGMSITRVRENAATGIDENHAQSLCYDSPHAAHVVARPASFFLGSVDHPHRCTRASGRWWGWIFGHSHS
jgi:KDO2-lipid IV(A) lauroyltransferase